MEDVRGLAEGWRGGKGGWELEAGIVWLGWVGWSWPALGRFVMIVELMGL